MSDFEEYESEFARRVARGNFDDAPRAEHQADLRRAVFAQFDQAALSPATRWQRALKQGRQIMRRPAYRLLVASAACGMIAAVWLFWPPSSAQAFHAIAEAIVAAKSARFVSEVSIQDQPKQKFETYYLAPGKFRQEIGDGKVVNIVDTRSGKMVSLAEQLKRATVMKMKNAPKEASSNDLFERVRDLLSKKLDAKDGQYERLGEKEIDGRRAVGFRFDSPEQLLTLWGDPTDGQPIRIETTWSGVPRTEVVMNNFELNVEVDPKLFDPTPPEGYKVLTVEIDASPLSEKDLVQALRVCGETGDGMFPHSLDSVGIQKIILDRMTKLPMPISDDDQVAWMERSGVIGRGATFALQLPASADAHYAGRDVKLGTKDRPIFWYKPEKAKDYRVIYADLTVQDVAQPPTVEGAIKIENTGKQLAPEKNEPKKD